MIADPIFSSFVPSAVAALLRSVGDEFSVAERQNDVTSPLGRKYHKALRAYENALGDCPWAPGALIIDESAHDGMMRAKMSEELARVQNEGLRILSHFGGALALNPDDGEES